MIPAEIEILPAAVQEARKAYCWYLRRSAAAASRLQAAFEAALEQIAQVPECWPTYLLSTGIGCAVKIRRDGIRDLKSSWAKEKSG